jgi:cytochrome bd-type quinol oxidase subunit 1
MDEKFEKPPTNRAKAWFRLGLWIVPTVFAYASGAGLEWIKSRFQSADSVFPVSIWIALIAGFVLGTGWIKARLNRRPRTYPNAFSDEVLFFFLAQVVLIPLLMMLILFCACLINPIQF